jgi:poly-gamma-glutamate synthesis protein (capsule biosynthesis protein)
MINIIAVGDIMPGGLLSDSCQPCANSEVLDLLRQGDVKCGTLECAFGNEPTYDEAKVADRGNVIYAKDSDIRRLKELHIDIVSLANNHFFDLGENGAQHTIELLDAEGILHCGAGKNLEEAGKPVVLEINSKKVAFLAFCDTNYKNVFYCTYATESSPGVNPMKESYVVSEIKKYATQNDYVIVMAHWGTENTFNPNVSSVKMAGMMLKAGACLVLGSHPHQIQPVINLRKGSIVYSMGNFLFPERLIAPPKVTYYPNELIDYSMLPVTEEYPLVDCVTLKTLPYWARVGQIVKSQISNNSIVSDYLFSFLNKDNCLTLLDERKSKETTNKLKGLSWLLKMRLYKPYMFVCRVFNSIRIRLKRLMR